MHGFDVEIERKIPVLVRAIEDRALMHIAGAIDQNIERAEFAADVGGERVDIVLRAHVELDGFLGLQTLKLDLDNICRDDDSTFGDKSFGDSTADALARSSDQCDLTLQSVAHACLTPSGRSTPRD